MSQSSPLAVFLTCRYNDIVIPPIKIDIVALLTETGIEYTLTGHTVSKGNVYIRCPFCGEEDKSFHMGIHLKTGKWGCWRNERHRGRKLQRLLMRLLHISWDQANRLLGVDQVSPDGFNALVLDPTRIFDTSTQLPAQPIELDKSFQGIIRKGIRRRFWQYLERRFPVKDVARVIETYELWCCLTGRFTQRIIIPLYHNESLIAWTGRTITDSRQRYLTYPASDAVKQTLFNHDSCLDGGRRLYICEGPFDAMKFDFYASHYQDRAIALFGKSPSPIQFSLLLDLAVRFDSVYILLDIDATVAALDLQRSLPGISARVVTLPDDVTDPGDLTPSSIITMCETLSARHDG